MLNNGCQGKFNEEIFVTRPYLPDLEEFKKGCEEIWKNRWLTNDGPMLHRFQHELAGYLGVADSNLALFNNGTLALELGYYAMGLAGGDVITTPFTFVATSHALKRIGATPVFADIDPATLCLDPARVEERITPRTRAIVPVHVYGHACDVEGFDRLGEKYGIPVIYDAAHAFGTDLHRHGAMSMFSFHPTKLFHSCEGGCLVFRDSSLQPTLFNLRNFAIQNELECTDVGSNAKMNELQALMGLECLKRIDELIDWRKRIQSAYMNAFAGSSVVSFPNLSLNGAYCPVLFRDYETRERVYAGLKARHVHARRYFYPLLTDFAPYVYAHGSCPIAEDAASRILALPTYHGLPLEIVSAIARIVLELAE